MSNNYCIDTKAILEAAGEIERAQPGGTPPETEITIPFGLLQALSSVAHIGDQFLDLAAAIPDHPKPANLSIPELITLVEPLLKQLRPGDLPVAVVGRLELDMLLAIARTIPFNKGVLHWQSEFTH